MKLGGGEGKRTGYISPFCSFVNVVLPQVFET